MTIAYADYDPFFRFTSFDMYVIAFYDIWIISFMFAEKDSTYTEDINYFSLRR